VQFLVFGDRSGQFAFDLPAFCHRWRISQFGTQFLDVLLVRHLRLLDVYER
jgi:hypothetical protein